MDRIEGSRPPSPPSNMGIYEEKYVKVSIESRNAGLVERQCVSTASLERSMIP